MRSDPLRSAQRSDSGESQDSSDQDESQDSSDQDQHSDQNGTLALKRPQQRHAHLHSAAVGSSDHEGSSDPEGISDQGGSSDLEGRSDLSGIGGGASDDFNAAYQSLVGQDVSTSDTSDHEVSWSDFDRRLSSDDDQERYVAEEDAERERERAQPGYHTDLTDDNEEMRDRKYTRRYLRDICAAGLRSKFLEQCAQAYLKQMTPEEEMRWYQYARSDPIRQQFDIMQEDGTTKRVCCMHI